MTFALLFALASAQLSGIDGTWHATIGSHDAVIALKSCSDGELIGVLPAEPTIQITGGNISGSNVIINFSGEDGGGPLSEFSFTGVLAGDNLSGTALVDGTLTTVDFNRVTANYEVQHMEVIDTDANATLLFNVVRLGGTFVGGGFTGFHTCDFIACGGMLESISVDPITGQHTITTVSSNVDGELLAYWDSTLKQFSGTWSSMSSSGSSDSGSFIGSQQGIANSSSFDAVLGLLTTFADGVEGETLIASDIFSAAYLNDGFNASDWDSRLSSWFSNYDFLQVEIGEVTTLITHNNGDENLWTRRLPQIEASIVVTGTNIATGAVETVYEFSPSAINTELSLLEATPVAKFIGNGASSDFEILLPLNKVDAAIGTSNVVWPFGVHGGGHPEGHPGADFWMAPGSPILAAAGGEVVMLDSSMLMIECRSGLLLQYEHLKNIDATLSIGTTVSAGQHLAEPEVDHFHFAIRHGIVLAPPLEYFTSAAQVDFDYLWENSQWPQEISEPLITNDMHIEFPHVVSWLNTDPAGSPAVIELTDTSPFDYVHTYRLLDSTGAVIDSGTADYNHMNGTLNFGAQYGLVDIVGPEMTLELSTSAPPTAFVSPSTFLFAE